MRGRRTLIVEPGRSRGALAAARGLASAGWEVGVACPADPLATYSRAVRWSHTVPPVGADPDGFLRAVNHACDAVGYRLVFGCDDAEVVALASRREEVHAEVPHADEEAVRQAMDKSRLGELAVQAGLSVPRSFAPGDPDVPAGRVL